MGARVIDSRGLAAELKEGWRRRWLGKGTPGSRPGSRPCWSARPPRQLCARWSRRTQVLS
jgi:hypothetical protein